MYCPHLFFRADVIGSNLVLKLSAGREDTGVNSAREDVRSYALGIIATGVVIAILYWARIVFITTITAVVIALILEPFVGLLTRIRLPRSLASLVVCLFAVTVIYFAGFAAWNQLSGIANDAPALKENITKAVDAVSTRIQVLEDSAARVLTPSRKSDKSAAPAGVQNNKKSASKKTSTIPLLPPPPDLIPEVRIHDDHNPIEDYIFSRLDAVYQVVLMSSFVPLLVYFMLSWRDHIYKSFLRFFDGPARTTVSQSLQGIAGVARAFVVGNFLIGVFLALLTSALFAAIRLPYPFLVGTLSGILSLVPYAGLVLAVLPPLLAGLATGAPSSVLLLSLAIAVILHLTAMNVLYPTIVGARVHLNPLVVTFSLMFWGFLWDAAGLVLAIPITAGIKAVCDHVAGLRKYGRFLGD